MNNKKGMTDNKKLLLVFNKKKKLIECDESNLYFIVVIFTINWNAVTYHKSYFIVIIFDINRIVVINHGWYSPFNKKNNTNKITMINTAAGRRGNVAVYIFSQQPVVRQTVN